MSETQVSLRSPVLKIFRCALLLGAGLITLSGCAYHHGAAYIQTDPPGAQVINMDDSSVLGITPVKIWWRESAEQRKFVNILVHKAGYRDKTTSFWVTLRHGNRQSALSDPQNVDIEMDKGE